MEDAMKCPQSGHDLAPFKVGSITVERCRECGGTWYAKDELRLIKDRERDEDYRWIDVDLWDDPERFVSGEQNHYTCPVDGKPMLTVHYGESAVHIDVCSQCHGMFLQKGAYQAIVSFFEKQVDTQTVGDYVKDLKDEFVEIFSGPEGVRSELADFTKVLHLLEVRFIVQHKNIAAALRSAAGGFPGT
jgi:Zn-finger nucleic acid-binding protein